MKTPWHRTCNRKEPEADGLPIVEMGVARHTEIENPVEV